MSGGNWRLVLLSCGWFFAQWENCSVPENPPNHLMILWLKILWPVYHRPRYVVRKIDLARWLWQSPMKRTRIAVFPLAICKSVFLCASVVDLALRDEMVSLS